MRRILLLLTAAMPVAVMAVSSAMPAFAHNAGPCVDPATDPITGAEPGHSEFATHHVVPAVGQESDHNPGLYRGYSACL